jgi:hypothetical protein
MLVSELHMIHQLAKRIDLSRNEICESRRCERPRLCATEDVTEVRRSNLRRYIRRRCRTTNIKTRVTLVKCQLRGSRVEVHSAIRRAGGRKRRLTASESSRTLAYMTLHLDAAVYHPSMLNTSPLSSRIPYNMCIPDCGYVPHSVESMTMERLYIRSTRPDDQEPPVKSTDAAYMCPIHTQLPDQFEYRTSI